MTNSKFPALAALWLATALASNPVAAEPNAAPASAQAGAEVPSATASSAASAASVANAASSPSAATPAQVTILGLRPGYGAPNPRTATRTDTPALQNPQSTQVVTRAVIDDQGALDLSEAVRNVAGVQFDFGFNGSAAPLLILRGFPSTSMTAGGSMSGSSSYYIDGTKVTGVPINMAEVESVEVIKGPSTVLYGRAEPGGLVNIVTRPVSSVPELGLEQTLGQFGLSRTSVEASGPLNDERSLRGRVSASSYRSDSIRDFVVDRLDAVSASLEWVPDARTRVTARLDDTLQRYRTDYGVPASGDRPADLPWSRQFNNSPDLSSNRSTSVSIDGMHRWSEAWQIKVRLISLRSQTSEVDVVPYRVDLGAATTPAGDCPGTGNPTCIYYYGARPEGRYRMGQFNADLTGVVQQGGVQHKLLFGIDSYSARKTGTTYVQQLDAVAIDVPENGYAAPLDTANAYATDDEDRNRWTGLYLQDQAALGHGVFLTGALRHDITSAIYAPPGTAPNRQSFTTPRVGAVWQFDSRQAVYAQYQDAVSANNGRDPISGVALAAERARQFELGHKLGWFDGRLSSTLAVYQLVKSNRASYLPAAEAPYYTVVTVGQARSRGLEWDVSGQVSPALALIGSYAYTETLVTSDPVYQGKQLANVARQTGSLWARYAIDSAWSTGAGVFAQGQRQGDVGNTFQLPGYARVDTLVARRFALAGAKASLQFNVDNLFDKKYYSASHQLVSDWIKLGTPRTAKATLRVDY
jgi:iron complex outermembrane receptor protein